MFGAEEFESSNPALSAESVTALLQQDSGCEVIADVIQEGFRRSNHQENLILCRYGFKPQLAWCREVLLVTNGQTRALARILIPSHELKEIPWIQRLGPQPLGSVLFDAYDPVRENIVRQFGWYSRVSRCFSLRAQQRGLDSGFNLNESYWLRSSVLNVQNKIHFLITECFYQ